MARQSRIHYPGAIYHVILRGYAGQDIFFSDEDRTYFYSLLAEGVDRFGCRIHAFCLMTDHVHLAVQVGELPLSRLMQNISFRYTRLINSSQDRTGPLFHGRYKAILIDRESYLLDLVRYIHLNPTRAGMGLDPKSHHWSSYRAYCEIEKLPWLTIDPVRSQFDPHERVAINRYQRYIVDGLREGHRPEFQKGSGTDRRVLGDKLFIDKALQLIPEVPTKPIEVQTVVELVTKQYKLSAAELRAPGKERIASEARAVIALIVFDDGIGTLTELGRIVDRAGATLSSAVTRLKNRMQNDSPLAEKLQSIRKQLTKLQR